MAGQNVGGLPRNQYGAAMSRRNLGPKLKFLVKRGLYYIVWTEDGRSRERSTGTADAFTITLTSWKCWNDDYRDCMILLKAESE